MAFVWLEFVGRLVMLALVSAMLVPFEIYIGHGRQSLSSRIRGFIFWTAGTLGALVTILAFLLVTDAPGTGPFPPLFVIPLRFEWAGWAAPILSPIMGAIVGDFSFYWFHRIQHRFLWRFHSVHHSIRELNALNAWHHISEQFFWSLFLIVSMTLFGMSLLGAYVWVAIILAAHKNYIHSTAAFHFGPLRAVFVDNRFHRIHHSLEPRHWDRNFGGTTTLWDRLFGTAHFPEANEWPDVGLADIDEPRNLRQWLDMPWRKRTQSDLAPAE